MISRLIDKFQNDLHFREIFAGSSIAFVVRSLGLLANYLFYFTISFFYGAEGIGVYSLAFSALNILAILGAFGLNTALLRFAGQFKAENSMHKLRMLYKDSIQLVSLTSLILALALILFSTQLASEFFGDPSLSMALVITGIMIPLFATNLINVELLRSLKKIVLSEVLRNLTRPAFSLVLLVILSVVSMDINMPVISLAMALLITLVLSSSFSLKQIRDLPSQEEGRMPKKELVNTSLPMLMGAFSFLLLSHIDTIMLGRFSNIQQVGIYNVALKIALISNFIYGSVNTIIAPKFAELYWGRNIPEFKKVVGYASKMIFLVSFPFLLIIFLFPGFLMGIFGEEFEQGKNALLILGVGQLVNVLAGAVQNVLKMTGHEHVFRNVMVSGAFLNVVLNYILIPIYGIEGAAIASLVCYVYWKVAAVIYVRLKIKVNAFYIPFLTS